MRAPRGIARSVLKIERLPNGGVANIWAGPGSGKLCSACGKRIDFEAVEIEVELPAALKTSALRFHADCYRIWSGEWDDPERR